MMLRLATDFHLIDKKNFVRASIRHAVDMASFIRTPELGEKIQLDDLDGRTIVGIVTKVKGDVVNLLVDWTTFHDSSKIQGRHEIRVAYRSVPRKVGALSEVSQTSLKNESTGIFATV